MNTKDILFKLRSERGLSQDELAQKVFVTRQAVSRWENGDTTPSIETLKLLSELYNVSINALLGTNKKLICHCCGMNLDESTFSREMNGRYNQKYCKWCYNKGEFTLDIWEKYAALGQKHFNSFKQQLINELNELHIEGMPKVDNLNVLAGNFINLEYELPNGTLIKFLNDEASYLACQLPSLFEDSRCFGIAAGLDFLLVCTYEKNGVFPELILYKRR